MEDKKEQDIIEEMQLVAQQMVEDDIEENPDIIDDYFECDCCGENKCMAGSIEYNGYRLCNDCVLIAEVSFAMNKISNIEELIAKFEDKKLENLCEFIKQEEVRETN